MPSDVRLRLLLGAAEPKRPPIPPSPRPRSSPDDDDDDVAFGRAEDEKHDGSDMLGAAAHRTERGGGVRQRVLTVPAMLAMPTVPDPEKNTDRGRGCRRDPVMVVVAVAVVAVALALAAAEAEDARGRTTAPEERAPEKARQRPRRDIAPSRTAPVLFVDWLVDMCPLYLVAGKRCPATAAAAVASSLRGAVRRDFDYVGLHI